MERYKIYQSLPETGLYENTKTGDTYIILNNPSVRIKNPTETAIKMLKDKAFERPTFIPSIDEINANLSENVSFDPVSNTYSSKLGDLVFKSKFLEEVEEKVEKALLDRKSNTKFIVKKKEGFAFSIKIPVLNYLTPKKQIIKYFKTKEEAMSYRDKFLKLNNMERFLNSSNYENFKISLNEIKFPGIEKTEDKEKYVYYFKNSKNWCFMMQRHYIYSSTNKEDVIRCRDKFIEANNLTLLPNIKNATIDWDKVIYPDSFGFPQRRQRKSTNHSIVVNEVFKEKFFKPCELYLTSDGELLTEEELSQRILKTESKRLTVRKVDISKVAEISVKIC